MFSYSFSISLGGFGKIEDKFRREKEKRKRKRKEGRKEGRKERRTYNQ
jgi:hypothetical protein